MFLFVIIVNVSVKAQKYNFDDNDSTKQEKTILKENIFYGGGFGLQFGDITAIEVLPEVSYKLHKYFYIGIGGQASYYKDFRYNVTRYVYGLKPFVRLFLFSDFYLQGEYEVLNVPKIDINTGYYTGTRTFVSGMLGGIGYRQKMGKRLSVMTTLLFNFTISLQTPYLNPIYRIGFIF